MKPDLTKPWCYYVPHDQDPDKHGGYVPSLVVEGEQGHHPMTGATGKEAPWIWGQTWEEACCTCNKVNEKRGISREEANRIVNSSIFHQFKSSTKRK